MRGFSRGPRVAGVVATIALVAVADAFIDGGLFAGSFACGMAFGSVTCWWWFR